MFSVTVTGEMKYGLYKKLMPFPDVEDPVVDFCESPPEFITSTSEVDIEWDEPIFHDNSRSDLTITQTHQFGRFPFGTTDVVYTATDDARNSVTCNISVVLQRKLQIRLLD